MTKTSRTQNRRSVLAAGLTTAATLGLTIPSALAMSQGKPSVGRPAGRSDPDHAIHAACKRWVAAGDALEALSEDDIEANLDTPLWHISDTAEQAIMETEAQTPAGAAVKIRIALAHMLSSKEQDAALRRNDLAFFDADRLDNLEWSERVLISVWQNLNALSRQVIHA